MSNDLRELVIRKTQATTHTSLERLRSLGLTTCLNVYSDQNIAELLTQHPTQMAFGTFTYIFADSHTIRGGRVKSAINAGRNMMGYEIGEELDSGFFELIGGQPRCSIIHDAFTYRIGGMPLRDYFEGFVNWYLEKIQSDPSLANYPEIVLYEQNPSFDFLFSRFGTRSKSEHYHRLYTKFFEGIRILEEEVVADFQSSLEPDFLRYIQNQRELASALRHLDVGETIARVYSLLHHLKTASCVTFVKVARLGFFAYARLKRTLESIYGPNEGRVILDKLTSGLVDDPTLAFNVMLSKLRDGTVSLAYVLKDFGHLGPNALEISGFRYHEMPELLEQYASHLSGDPMEDWKKRREENLVVGQKVLQENPSKANELERDIRIAKQFLALREKQKYYFLMVYDLLRQHLLHLEILLKLEKGSIFLLDPTEISQTTILSASYLRAMLNKRKEETVLLRRLEVPPVIFSDKLEEITYQLQDGEAGELRGIGVTAEIAIGKAIVVLKPDNFDEIHKLTGGAILVAPTTDPTWAPLIAAVGGAKGGLVTEVGGPLAHGAIVAREYGIAAVLNVGGATKIIKDGDIIEVNGKAGTVTIVKRANEEGG